MSSSPFFTQPSKLSSSSITPICSVYGGHTEQAAATNKQNLSVYWFSMGGHQLSDYPPAFFANPTNNCPLSSISPIAVFTAANTEQAAATNKQNLPVYWFFDGRTPTVRLAVEDILLFALLPLTKLDSSSFIEGILSTGGA
ncbi:hypothetical protein CEXT_253441 [Caerostris extrusa]|uniref:Uncharacterized protein n=1 Tax=Caerostris extrusa TaxID=172846 RepID=A0AAV4N2I0_CAEEX|nr:hypothetical protein CEXT_253441 [Caerostris extrusa]